jgi:hypothetical protein
LSFVLSSLAIAPATLAAPPCGVESSSLGNGGFEDPGAPAGDYALFDSSQVSPWNTTDVSNQVEVWSDGFEGVPAFEGASFAELNANSFGTLYQDVVTVPGTTMNWSLHHRGRDATDVMKVLIGDATTADVNSDAGWDVTSPDISDDQTGWGTATGSYVVPAGQTCTRFAFRAVSSGVGIDSYGNLIDGIAFSIPVDAPPTPTSSQAPAAASRTPRPHVTNPPTDAMGASSDGPGRSGATILASILTWSTLVALVAARRRRGGLARYD